MAGYGGQHRKPEPNKTQFTIEPRRRDRRFVPARENSRRSRGRSTTTTLGILWPCILWPCILWPGIEWPCIERPTIGKLGAVLGVPVLQKPSRSISVLLVRPIARECA